MAESQAGKQDKIAWQIGYGAFSVRKSNVSQVKNYIHRQEEHHKRVSFREEIVALLKKNSIEYDEQYLLG